MKTLLSFSLLLFCSSCSWVDRGEDELDPLEEPLPVTDVDAATLIDNIELKQARIWARIDELESMVVSHQQRLQMLEHGRVLKHPGHKETKINKQDELKSKSHLKIRSEQIAKTGKPLPAVKIEKPLKQNERDFAHAHKLFKEGRFAKAYLEYSRLGKHFSNRNKKGESRFWMSRCWYELNELNSAKRFFMGFLREFPKSPLRGQAQLYLAKIDLAQGKREIAMKRLEGLIGTLPKKEDASRARELLSTLVDS